MAKKSKGTGSDRVPRSKGTGTGSDPTPLAHMKIKGRILTIEPPDMSDDTGSDETPGMAGIEPLDMKRTKPPGNKRSRRR